ncbi:hypothetical protein ACIQFU_25160 [Streptomyces sp. NPDC093065]|uniref:hypothetical protein n=1 Tax=Streptomyces sp. NPDC093065 TaxID=3366021 RepID=UPI003802892B
MVQVDEPALRDALPLRAADRAAYWTSAPAAPRPPRCRPPAGWDSPDAPPGTAGRAVCEAFRWSSRGTGPGCTRPRSCLPGGLCAAVDWLFGTTYSSAVPGHAPRHGLVRLP